MIDCVLSRKSRKDRKEKSSYSNEMFDGRSDRLRSLSEGQATKK